jgi:hypothetical protein
VRAGRTYRRFSTVHDRDFSGTLKEFDRKKRLAGSHGTGDERPRCVEMKRILHFTGLKYGSRHQGNDPVQNL